MNRFLTYLPLFAFLVSINLSAQDTLRISYYDFIDKALQNSGQVKYIENKIDMAENRVEQAKDQRFLPSLNYRSEHALVPGVSSPNGFDEESIYLDPDAINDWDKFGLFTRFRITGVQPVFTWGAINKAIDAARLGVQASVQEVEASKFDLEVRLFELYHSYILALEIERLLKDAEDKIAQIERGLEDFEEENPEEFDESELFKFRIFKSQFGIQQAEVEQSLNFVKETWKYALRNDEGIIYEPEIRFLEPFDFSLSELFFYQESALNNRAEIRGLEYGEEALLTYISSLKSQNLPGLFFGFTTTFASTPVRPRQPNPFINTPENTFNTAVGFTIRQNLNFFQANTSLERSKIEMRKMSDLKEAASDGVILEVNEAYKNASIAEVKVDKTDEALVTAKEWLRMEQLDYDFGIGEVKDLIDAMKTELELRLKEKEYIFEFNSAVAKLNKSAGLPLMSQ